MRKAVFLDRDGVLNEPVIRNGKPFPPTNIHSVRILPGVVDALQSLRSSGWLLIVITNQPDVARGTSTFEEVEAINRYLKQSLPIDEFRTCYHDDDDKCYCRKPLPGALISAAETHEIDLEQSYMIGDRWRDIEAGNRAGCKTIFLDYAYNERRPLVFHHCVQSLAEAATIILGDKNEVD